MIIPITLFADKFNGIHDTQITQLSHSIFPCGALYKLDPEKCNDIDNWKQLKYVIRII